MPEAPPPECPDIFYGFSAVFPRYFIIAAKMYHYYGIATGRRVG